MGTSFLLVNNNHWWPSSVSYLKIKYHDFTFSCLNPINVSNIDCFFYSGFDSLEKVFKHIFYKKYRPSKEQVRGIIHLEKKERKSWDKLSLI